MPNSPKLARQYEAISTTGGFLERPGRGLLEVHGADRADWLNNLVTNVVKTLAPGEGNYAFAVTLKGRTLFDANVLVLKDQIWLDIDRRLIDRAKAHLDRYTITEDVSVIDVSAENRRFAVIGPRAHLVVQTLGFGNLVPMASLQHTGGRILEADIRMIRHDFAGVFSVELYIESDEGDDVVQQIGTVAVDVGLIEIEPGVVNILRIEAGIPASVDDIDDEVLPPETGQIERGISYHKGCYLGQEVIERMRAHGVLARKLVGLRFEGDELIEPGTKISTNDEDVGRVTSGCHSEALDAVLALGYVKTAHANPGTPVFAATGADSRTGIVVALPVPR